MTWQCCGGVSADEEPSYLTLWDGNELRGRIIDPMCDMPLHLVLFKAENGNTALPGCFETPEPLVAQRLEEVFRFQSINSRVSPGCVSDFMGRRHAALLYSTMAHRTLADDMPPAVAYRVTEALSALVERPEAWCAAWDLRLDNVASKPLRLVSDGRGIEISPLVGRSAAETIRLRIRNSEVMGTQWHWLKATSGQRHLARKHADTVCAAIEVLLSLETRPDLSTVVVGNWLKMPREVRIGAAGKMAA
jgi:hypothetical protein